MNKIVARSQFDHTPRKELTLLDGLTIAEAVEQALGNAPESELSRTRVMLCTPHGATYIERDLWDRVRPKAGVTVVITVVAGKDGLKTILSLAVTFAAVSLGAAWGPTVAGWLGTSTAIGTAVVTAAVSVIGGLILNSLFPPIRPDTSRRNTYTISGWRNPMTPDGVVPQLFGTMRVAPPFAATPYTEVHGSEQYIRSLFVIGEGPIDIDDIRIGETSIGEFENVDIEVRSGLSDDLPVTIYPEQIVEEQIGVELTRPLPRDEAGEVIGDEPSIETPVVRTTGLDAKRASVILSWPSGLVRYDDNGQKQMHTVTVKIEQRAIDAEEWQNVKTLAITRAKAEGFFRQYSWKLPSRGQWQVRCTMMTDETEDSKVQQRCNWAALQTIRPEYPLAYPRPLALIAVRIKATHQLSGQLDNLNCLASRRIASWDAQAGEWTERVTENPADAMRSVLQAPSLPSPSTDAQINIVQLQDWAEWCQANGLTYNRYLIDENTTFADILTEIAGAGRSTPRHDGAQWGVVTDRPTAEDEVITEINPLNSWGSKWQRSFGKPPAGFVVKFPDAANDYKETQRIIPWPGHVGELHPLETLQLPGKVYADEVFLEARRRQLEVTHRPDTRTVIQDGRVSIVERGDTIVQVDTCFDEITTVGRVTHVQDNLITINEAIRQPDLDGLAIRWRVVSDDNPTGVARMAPVKVIGAKSVAIDDAGPYPSLRDIVSIGSTTQIEERRIVRGVEQTDDWCRIIYTIPAGLDIDAELAQTEVPAWSPRVGETIDRELLQPSAPRFVSVTSGVKSTGSADQIDILVEPGPGVVETSTFRIKHRVAGTSDWTTFDIAAAEGGCSITVYPSGTDVELTVRGISPADQLGPEAPILPITVGSGDAPIPDTIDEDSIDITALLGGVLVQVALGSDEGATSLRIYRSQSDTLDRETDLAGELAVDGKAATYSFPLGDTNRQNLASDSWTLGAGWAPDGSKFAHTAGTADDISQAFEPTVGKYYRISGRVTTYSAGTLTPQLQGGSLRSGAAVGASGVFFDRIQAVTDNDTLAFAADATFDGSLDRIVIYKETKACLDQGTHFVWLEAVNADGAAGPVSGPHSFTIV